MLRGDVTHDVEVSLERTWRGVFDVNLLFEDYKMLIQQTKEFLYIEHQYPFQNYALTYCLCEVLKLNLRLKVIIVTSVKTDLPTGLVGDLFDWSQDHVIQHLQLIHSCAPERVGIYGLVNQDPIIKQVKAIYVHSKIIISDDKLIVTGSTNTDNVSFFYSSELSVQLRDSRCALSLRMKLFEEHLGEGFTDPSWDAGFERFKEIAAANMVSLKQGMISGRPVSMAPIENYEFILRTLHNTSKITQLLTKFGLNPSDWQQIGTTAKEATLDFVKHQAKL
eukprot:TRINITY_DN5731_c3_g1_i1.p1 TRINITY_DN5731_c3_g1~~TRINITY_DN5731_c3_g1_i1.p1  ORF type:complete len:278 (+),score=62.12 TRINITY_DN5731_c3_g1_i1:532-1365(+)